MDLERERLVEGGAAAVAVGVMFAVLYLIGRNYTQNATHIGPDGGVWLVGAIVFFICFMIGTGLLLAFVVSSPEVEDDGTDSAGSGGSDDDSGNDSEDDGDHGTDAEAGWGNSGSEEAENGGSGGTDSDATAEDPPTAEPTAGSS